MEENMKKNNFCVISKNVFGDYSVRDIQTNSAWSKNPYGDEYAVVPDDMIESIMETYGYCDLELNENETEIISFTAREIPISDEIEEKSPATNEELEEQITVLELALVEQYEENLKFQNEIIELKDRLDSLI